ncbi:pentapeptide repeat-containing protein [Bathymodiolus septemdierum thioautotrophic gill symbiont]|uniref:Pentapeptide repeat-containing protein n=1 Tax=endosymbiont of Bathymodiolus septemdierum str. Myojin knoll TaxID=1303921 RepID=A0A0P0UU42_9GAMM|nr:pentapeptide repeat-containing protein [Bathymodiolus septemdierum thioautotrophic gill symbiont]BAS68469.1 hypothetical protein BSEPE_1491 [endosymbiont of Bathymodiolus septemdierum str. Myojin knoll]
MSGFSEKLQKIKVYKNIDLRYVFDNGYFRNFYTHQFNQSYWQHQNKIAEFRRIHNNHKKTANTTKRAFGVISAAVVVASFNSTYVPWFVANIDNILIKITSVGVSGIVMSAPIVFVIWIFRDKNHLMELDNARKDTNLKEFQQLQRWATGNIEGDEDNADNKIALQISALHSLRGYLKGEYGESFRRGAYEIFRASLATQHQKILQEVKKQKNLSIADAINRCSLTKQLNIIAHEEWFNLLINHDFPTNNISLLGVDLQETYLHHRIYDETLDLSHAQLQGANLLHAQLQGANLWHTQLQGANLRHTQLQGANLIGAQLQGANLRHTQLQGANLIMHNYKGRI